MEHNAADLSAQEEEDKALIDKLEAVRYEEQEMFAEEMDEEQEDTFAEVS